MSDTKKSESHEHSKTESKATEEAMQDDPPKGAEHSSAGEKTSHTSSAAGEASPFSAEPGRDHDIAAEKFQRDQVEKTEGHSKPPSNQRVESETPPTGEQTDAVDAKAHVKAGTSGQDEGVLRDAAHAAPSVLDDPNLDAPPGSPHGAHSEANVATGEAGSLNRIDYAVSAQAASGDEAPLTGPGATPELAGRNTYDHNGTLHDFGAYDEVRIWQTGSGAKVLTQCWLSRGGKAITQVPVMSLEEAREIERQFIARRGRVN